jgi:hypothetical protein
MSSARFWHGSRLIAGWIVGIGVFLLVRWVLARGVAREVFRDGRVERLSGIWSSSFVTLVTVVLGGAVAALLVGITVSWIVGRHERKAMRRYALPDQRRILM